MKTLLLHNDNIPQSLLDYKEIEKAVLRPSIADFNYDSFISKKLSELLKDKQYNCIILPYSLSNENYMEYTGLRVALHIRLSPEWNHSRVPILFVGPDSIEEVVKFSELGDVLVTPFVFTTKKTQVEDMNKILEWINKNVPKEMSDVQYKTFLNNFLNKIHIKAPSNYATHHSIANEWAVMRWIDMFKWDNEEPKLTHDDFKNMLYFKYLLAKAGQRDKNKDKIDPKIEFDKLKKTEGVGKNIEKLRIVYIDDEYNKGWENILSEIFTISGIKKENFICYKEFQKEKSKQDLITDIQSFINKNDADCYLLDLRLHDDDFENTPDELSGLQIAQYIHEKNQGNQVVVFTASNKVWNLKKAAEYGVTDFVIKESPEFNYNMDESYRMYCEFAGAIVKAIKKSYLIKFENKRKQFENKINNLPKKNDSDFENVTTLDSYIKLSLLDEERTLKTNMLNLCVLIEKQCKSVYPEGDDNIKEIINGNKAKFFFVKDKKDKNLIVDVVFFDKLYTYIDIQTQDPIKFMKLRQQYPNSVIDIPNVDSHNHITQIIAALRYYYELSEEICKLGLKFKNERNKAAHGGKIDFTVEKLKEVFSEIVIPILNHDTH